MKRILIPLLIIIFLCSAAVSSFAWLTYYIPQQITANAQIITQYFDHGTGTEQDPYVITRPIHYYHLVELYQLKYDVFADTGLYYQIGYDMDNDDSPEVYEYDNSGAPTGNTSTTLNMAAYSELRPIGTSVTPFCSNFNGNNLTISNLTVNQDGLCDVGIFGYTGLDALIHDVYFDNVTIKIDDVAAYANSTDFNSQTEIEHTAHTDNKAYVGYLVGHAETALSMTNVYINNCTISGSPSISTLECNWGYYGYCRDAKTLEEFVARVKGSGAGWGGSIAMNELYNRLYAINNVTATTNYVYDRLITYNPDGTIKSNEPTLTGRAYTNYQNNQAGSFVFSQARGNYLYLHGGTTITEHYLEYTGNTITGYYIHNGNNYLSIVNGEITNTTQANAVLWSVPSGFNGTSKIYASVNGTNYYLSYTTGGWFSDTGLTLGTNANNATTWTFNRNNNTYTLSNRTTGWNAQTYYVRYNNGWTISTNNSTALTFTEDSYEETRIDNSRTRTYIDYTGNNNTYLPLLVNDDRTAADGNTGYIISGSNDRTTSDTYPARSGDIRVSKYSTSDISNSYSGGKLTNVYTINLNGSQSTIDPDNLVKYSTSVIDFLDGISDGNIYGLHFMSGPISMDNIVTAAYAKIGDETFTNYQLPANSIDFNVIRKGYINFFAGTYFANNNSFFSLHKIERDEDTNNIISIKEISEIYSDSVSAHSYIFKYTDGSYSDQLTSDYSLVFSTSQIKKHDSLTNDAVYYFEIPVNAGEYALGSVDGGTGAYLMYLDIATNGGMDSEQTEDTFGSVEYRTYDETVENSILLLTYTCAQNAEFSANVTYNSTTKRYTVRITSTSQVEVKVTLLDSNYSVDCNNVIIQDIGITRIMVSS